MRVIVKTKKLDEWLSVLETHSLLTAKNPLAEKLNKETDAAIKSIKSYKMRGFKKSNETNIRRIEKG